jgi:hypothetical protein
MLKIKIKLYIFSTIRKVEEKSNNKNVKGGETYKNKLQYEFISITAFSTVFKFTTNSREAGTNLNSM